MARRFSTKATKHIVTGNHHDYLHQLPAKIHALVNSSVVKLVVTSIFDDDIATACIHRKAERAASDPIEAEGSPGTQDIGDRIVVLGDISLRLHCVHQARRYESEMRLRGGRGRW